jgi:uncharacterized membrane protein
VVPLPYPVDSILPNGEKIFSSEAVSISDDGLIIAGNLYFDQRFSPQHHMSYPCVWIYHPLNRNGLSYELLCVLEDIPGGDDCASIDQVSGNGLVLVGTGSQVIANPDCWFYPVQACKWTLTSTDWENASCGLPEALTNLEGYSSAGANGVNYTGSVIVGVAFNATGPCQGETFINTPLLWNGNDVSRPPQDLSNILNPMIPAGWTLYEASRVSADGMTITGYAIDSDWHELGWVAGLPVKAVPVSNWALVISIGLLIGLFIFRYNKANIS